MLESLGRYNTYGDILHLERLDIHAGHWWKIMDLGGNHLSQCTITRHSTHQLVFTMGRPHFLTSPTPAPLATAWAEQWNPSTLGSSFKRTNCSFKAGLFPVIWGWLKMEDGAVVILAVEICLLIGGFNDEVKVGLKEDWRDYFSC